MIDVPPLLDHYDLRLNAAFAHSATETLVAPHQKTLTKSSS